MSALIKEDPADRFWSRLSCQERHQIMSQDRQGESSGSGPNLISTPLEPAIERYLKIKEGQNLRPLTLRQIRWKLGMLQKAFGGSKCHEITTTMMEDWFRVKEWKRSTIDGVMAKIGPFFNWCIREAICIHNPLKYIILPKKDESAPCIFSPSQVQDLMSNALLLDPCMLPYLALGIFAGIRPEELMRLSWADVGPDMIEITAHKAKSRQRRLVSLSGNLRSWLDLGGDLPPRNKRKRLERLREASEVSWGHDIMRHTFASYHLAHHGSADRTAHELGHRDTKMLFGHYRELVSRNHAAQFWAISPVQNRTPSNLILHSEAFWEKEALEHQICPSG